MKNIVNSIVIKRLRTLICISLLFIFHFSFSNHAVAQEAVPLCSDWVATVDEQTQRIVLRWRPSPDSSVMGYHICTGTPCLNYDTVFGRLDTTYICMDHDPLEQHTYRLHVFDSVYNVSELTPPFGNMVLTAVIPECEGSVNVSWTPYSGMPDGIGGYRLMAKLDPIDTAFELILGIGADETLEYSFDLPEEVTMVNLKVLAYNTSGTLFSQSNIVSAERLTARAACCNNIDNICFDSVENTILLTLNVDSSFKHTLWRSIDGSPWRIIDTIRSATTNTVYRDTNINRYDSQYCYQLSVRDECGMNEQFSCTAWVAVPAPPPASIYIPNIILTGSETNCTFLPVMQGLMGDMYELSIYNRNGLLVFHTEDPLAAWQPPDNIKQGAYTYYIRLRFNNNRVHTYAGTVVVVR